MLMVGQRHYFSLEVKCGAVVVSPLPSSPPEVLVRHEIAEGQVPTVREGGASLVVASDVVLSDRLCG